MCSNGNDYDKKITRFRWGLFLGVVHVIISCNSHLRNKSVRVCSLRSGLKLNSLKLLLVFLFPFLLLRIYIPELHSQTDDLALNLITL